MTELLEKAEELKACPICRGAAQKFERTIGPGAHCNGECDCPWYHVVVPLEAWQRLPRVSDATQQVLDDMLQVLRRNSPDIALDRLPRWRRLLATSIDDRVGVWMNAYADACLNTKPMRECIEATAKELNINTEPGSDFGWVMKRLPQFASTTEHARRRLRLELRAKEDTIIRMHDRLVEAEEKGLPSKVRVLVTNAQGHLSADNYWVEVHAESEAECGPGWHRQVSVIGAPQPNEHFVCLNCHEPNAPALCHFCRDQQDEAAAPADKLITIFEAMAEVHKAVAVVEQRRLFASIDAAREWQAEMEADADVAFVTIRHVPVYGASPQPAKELVEHHPEQPIDPIPLGSDVPAVGIVEKEDS